MKIAHYEQMMDYLTGPRESFRKGGSVTTPKRGLVDEPGSYSGKKTLDIKKYKELEKQKLSRRVIAEKLGMSLSTLEKKIKELDAPLDYKGKDILKDPDLPFLMKDPELVAKMKETKRTKFRATPLGERLQWIADNGKNYETPKKFREAYEKHFKHKLGSEEDALFHFSPKDKATTRYKKSKVKMVALGSIDGLQNTGKTGAQGGDVFSFKKGFSEDEIFKASIIQNNPKVQKQFKNLFKNIADNVSEYQETGPEGIVKRLEKDGGNLLNDFDFLENYDPEPGAKRTIGGVHTGVTRRSLINVGIPDKQIIAFQSVRQPVLSLKNILTNLKNYPESFGKGFGISATTAKKLTSQLDNFMKGYGEVSNIVKQIDADLGDKSFNKIFGGINFEHTLAKQFGKDYKYLPRNYLLKGQFTTQKFNLFKREVFDLPLIRLMKQYEAGKISGDKVQSFIDDFNTKTNNYADFSFDTEKGKLAYTDNKVKYDLSRYNNPDVAKKELADNIKLTMSDEFQKGFKGTVGAEKQLKLFKSKEAKDIAERLAILGCGNLKADGGRIGFQTGATPTRQCILAGANKINNPSLIKTGAEARNAAQFLNRAYKVGRGILKFGVIPEAIFVAGESLIRMGMGDTLSESVLRATDYLLPGNQTKLADRSKLERTVGPENAATIMQANEYKQAQKNLTDMIAQRDQNQMVLDDSEFGYTSTINSRDQLALDNERIKKAQADLKAKFQPEAVMDFATMKEAESADIAKSRSFFPKFVQDARKIKTDDIETLAAPEKEQAGIAPPMFTMDDLAGVVIDDQMLQAEKDRLGGAPEFTKRNQFDFLRQTDEDYNNLVLDLVFNEGRKNLANRERLFGASGTFGGQPIKQKLMYDFAGGGIAKLAGKSSGPPPESGPLPQGLDFLIKRGRQS